MRHLLAALSLFSASLCAGAAAAQEVWITPDMPFFEFDHEGETLAIEREQNT